MAVADQEPAHPDGEALEPDRPQTAFHQFAGPLHSVVISPASSVIRIGKSRNLRAVCRDRSGRTVEEGLAFAWSIAEGGGRFETPNSEIVRYFAPEEPALVRLTVAATQAGVVCEASALVTVTDSLISGPSGSMPRQGLPGYSYENAPGQLWRSRYETEQNVIVINNGHRDFVFSARNRASQLRYIARLFVKELVLRNFPGETSTELLDRMLELMLYLEKHLR